MGENGKLIGKFVDSMGTAYGNGGNENKKNHSCRHLAYQQQQKVTYEHDIR